MRQGGSPEDVLVVATDGSGGDSVGMGVVVIKLGGVSDLSGALADHGRMCVVRSMSARLPMQYGTSGVSNQHAEDFGAVAGLMASIKSGAVMLIVDNLQTVEDLVSAGHGDSSSRRMAMRHRCEQAREMIRSGVACVCVVVLYVVQVVCLVFGVRCCGGCAKD